MNRDNRGMGMWVIYAPGTDGTMEYKARWWHLIVHEEAGSTFEPTPIAQSSPHLTVLQDGYREAGFVRFDRNDTDPANIVECWA